MDGERTEIVDEEGNKRSYSFDFSFWSHDGFETDANGYMRKQDDFSAYADQQLVFDLLGREVLDQAWEGYNTCLFAYGQTG